MKILYIITQADGGGAQKYVLTLAKNFKGEIAAGYKTGQLFDDAAAAQLNTYPLKHLKRNINPWHDFLAIFEIRKLIKNLRPDIVHLNSSKAGILGSFAAIGLKTKVIFTAHGFVYNEPLPFWLKSLYLALEKIASDHRDYIICVSDADKELALKHHLIDASQICTIHNGLAPIDFLPRNEARKTLGLPSDKFIFGTIANFYKTKGLDVLVKAVGMMDKDIRSQCMFVIIGDGSEFKNLKLEINNLGLENIIKTPGKMNDAARCLRAFDCFVLPSRKEGFPLTILEAMQAGLPIVAANVGGVPEVLGDAGILIQADDPNSLIQTLQNLKTDSKKMAILSQKALDRSRLFTANKMLEETNNIYEKIFKSLFKKLLCRRNFRNSSEKPETR